ncbi:MAG TPA: rubredoxin [Candidatus Paceibacterota bacterium]|nr:rubredoxin [Candidatus Paceibacterota bacterium]
MQYICQICGYIYDEDKEGKKFEDLAEEFKCPECKVGRKSDFKLVEPITEEVPESPEAPGEEMNSGEDEDKD